MAGQVDDFDDSFLFDGEQKDKDFDDSFLFEEPATVKATAAPAQSQAEQPAAQVPAAQTEPKSPLKVAGQIAADRAGDVAVDLSKGVVSFGQSIIGLGSLATGGLLSDGMRSLGYNPEETNKFLSDLYSDARKLEEKEIEGAEGFVGTVEALIKNPGATAGKIVETTPMMLGSMAAARAFAAKAFTSAKAAALKGGATQAAATKIAIEASSKAATRAAAVAEGAQQAGNSFDQYMAEGMDLGRAYVASIGSGITTAGFAWLGGTVGKKIGLGDVEAGIGAKGGLVRRVLKGGAQEGVMEELPQSMTEQMWDNYAHEKPLTEGVAKAGGTGLVVGFGAGGAFSAFQKGKDKPKFDQQAPNTPFNPTHKVSGGVDAMPVTRGGQPVPDTYIDKSGRVVRDPMAVQVPVTAPVDINGESLDADATMEAIKAEVMGNTATPEARQGIINSAMGTVSPTLENHGRAHRPPQGVVNQAAIDKTMDQAARDARMGEREQSEVIGIDDDGAPIYATPYTEATRDIEKPETVSDIDTVSVSPTTGDITNTAEVQKLIDGASNFTVADNGAGKERVITVSAGKGIGVIHDGTTISLSDSEIKELRKLEVKLKGNLITRLEFREKQHDLYRSAYRRSLNKTQSEAKAPEIVGIDEDGAPIYAQPELTAEEKAQQAAAIDEAAHEAATSPKNNLPEPTDAQKESGNYKVGKISLHGMDISIENPKGSTRSGADSNGEKWSVSMPAHYGYIKRTEGADGDHVDVYIGESPESENVFIVNQKDAETGKFDELKVIMGAQNIESAMAIYFGGFSDGLGGKRAGDVFEMKISELKEYLKNGKGSKSIKREEGNARIIEASLIQNLAKHAGQNKESKEPALSQLRGKRDKGSSGIDSVHSLPKSGGRATNAETPNGQDRQQRKLRAGEPALGDKETAGTKYEEESSHDSRRGNKDADRVGGTEEFGSINDSLQAIEGDDRGRSSDDTSEIQREKKQLETKTQKLQRELAEKKAGGEAAGPRVIVNPVSMKDELTEEARAWAQNEIWKRKHKDYRSEPGEPKGILHLNPKTGGTESWPVTKFSDAELLEELGMTATEVKDSVKKPAKPKQQALKVQRYQWKANREGGQEKGNLMEIRPLTAALFKEHVLPKVRSQYKSFKAYKAAFPENTHIAIYKVHTARKWKMQGLGPQEELVPTGEAVDEGWVIPVDSFASAEAVDFAYDVAINDQGRKMTDAEKAYDQVQNEISDVRAGLMLNAVNRGDSFSDADKQNILKSAEIYPELKEQLERKTKPASKQRTVLGENTNGHEVQKDKNGVRSYIESGIRIEQPVGIIPGQGIEIQSPEQLRAHGRNEFLTVQEIGEFQAEEQKAFNKQRIEQKTDSKLEAAERRLAEFKTDESWELTPEQADGLTRGIYPQEVIDAQIVAESRPETHEIDTPERNAKRIEWFDEAMRLGLMIDGEQTDLKHEKKAYIIMGPPAAGKSSIADPLAKEIGARLIDADIVKTLIPEFDNGIGANAVHKESKDINNRIMAEAMANGENIVFPAVGKTEDAIRSAISDAESKGYEVNLYYVHLPVEKSIERAVTRFYRTGRYVPLDYIKEAVDSRPPEVYDIFLGERRLNNYAFFSNDVPYGEKPLLVAEKTDDSTGIPGRIAQPSPERERGSGPGSVGTERAAEQDRADVEGIGEVEDATPAITDNQEPDTRSEPQPGEAVGEQRADADDTGRVPGTDAGGRDAGGVQSRQRKPKRAPGRKGAGTRTRTQKRAGDSAERDNGRSGPAIRTTGNYRITEADRLGKGGAMEKARANVAAIRIIKSLQEENRQATRDEQAQLVKYVGWGDTSIKNKLFPSKAEPTGNWKALHDELRELLTEEELKTAARSVQYAHYTSKPIIDGIYSAIEGFGLKSGMAIEGGAGTGHFLGLMPGNMNVHYTGVEMDIISGEIAKALYPESGMRTGDFTRMPLPQNHFDLSIGNPPFASITVKNDRQYRANKFMLHDYFIAKQIDAVKPGGIAVFVTSKGTMDKVDDAARAYLAERANLIGAVRLPQTAFKETAGTEVVTDILFFQKKKPEGEPGFVEWTDTKTIKVGDGEANINQYFIDHPEMVLGKHALTGSMYRSDEYTVEPTGDIVEQLADAVGKLPKNIYTDNLTDEMLEEKVGEFDIAPEEHEASYYVDNNNQIRQVLDGVGQVVPIRGGEQRTGKSKAQAQQIRDYITLRDAVMHTYKEMSIEGDIAAAQRAMTRAYNAFVKAHGPINQVKVVNRKDGKTIITEPIISNLNDDPEAYRVAGIEKYDEARNKAEKGDIFKENIISRFKEPQIESAIDALNITMNDRGYIDIDYLLEKYPGELGDVLAELGSAVYVDPASGRYVTDDEYLSGNVKAKLEEAITESETDSSFRRNVQALEAVQPENKELSQIPINLGNHWMAPWVMEKFAKHEVDYRGTIGQIISGDTSRWTLNGKALNREYSTKKRNVTQILEAALNNSTIKVYNYFMVEGSRRQELDSVETAAANQKVQELKSKFKLWAKDDPEVAEFIYNTYNEVFNTDVPRVFNGDHLLLPGLSRRFQPKIVDGVKKGGLHPWVRNAVWRVLQRGNMYMAHTVGAGKTLASITSAMEMRRLGLAKKPTFSVLKSTLKQFAAEFYEAYPNAKVLIADENQLDKKNRRRFMARMANEEWDAIIMTHQAFQNIQLSPQFVNDMVESDLNEYRSLLEEVDSEDRATRSQIERMIENMENKLVEQSDQVEKDAGLTFEELGIDFVFVDEAHTHKKIPFPTTQTGIKGVDANGSAIAYDLYLKSRYMNTVNPGRNLVLMSGTPVTNTLGEVFNIQRYLQPGVLEKKNISSFDSWSATFADIETDIEMQPNGKYKPVTRMSRFVGVPGLLRDFLQVADIVSNDDLNKSMTIKRPDVVGGQRQIKVVAKTPELEAYQQTLDSRIKALEKKKGPPKKGDDNILVVITDGKKSAIDMRLVGIEQTAPSKLDAMIDDVYTFWHETKDNEYYSGGKKEAKKGATQLIFTEIRQAAGFDIYDYIKEQLVKRGVPAREIAFIQDFNNSSKKKRLFKDMNTGIKRVLIGGSKNLGTGTNVQQRLGKISHLDIDWVPANIIQREGRGIRQGNKNEMINIDAYATEGTVDSTMWQMNERKQNMIDQVMSGDLSIDSVEDISNEASQMAMAKALSSGNPLLLEQAGIEADVAKLESLQFAHQDKKRSVMGDLRESEGNIGKAIESLPMLKRYAEQYVPTAGDKFSMIIDGKKYDERKKAGVKIIEIADKNRKSMVTDKTDVEVGSIGGFDIVLSTRFGLVAVPKLEKAESIKDAHGRIAVSPHTNIPEEDANAVGIVRQIENSLKALSEVHDIVEESIEIERKHAASLSELKDSVFQYTDELEQKRQRLEEINKELEADGTDTPIGPDEEPQLSARSTAATGPAKGVTEETAQTVIDSFKAELKGNLAGLRFVFKATKAEAFGSDKAAEMRKQGQTVIKGAYYPQSGVVLLIGEDLDSGADVLETLRHEVIAHFGLNLFDAKQKQVILDKIKSSRQAKTKAMRDLWARIDRVYSDKTEDTKAEEVLAAVAESKQLRLQKWWNDLVVMIRKYLKQIGLIDDVVGKPELQALVNTLADAISSGRAQRNFPDGVLLQAAYHGSPHKFDKFSLDNIGTFDPNEANILYSRGEEPVGSKFGMPEETRLQAWQRWLQNAFNRVGQLQDTILEQGGTISPESDVYQAEELSSGKTTARLRELDQDHMKPLIAFMDLEGITLEELDDFLRAKHAPERNDYIASINEDMQDGGSGMTYMEADATMERLADKRDALEEAAAKVYEINRMHVATLVAAGHIDQEVAEEWQDRWDYYVPLKGKVEEDLGIKSGSGSGYSVSGSGVKAAMGRGEGNMSESPTAHAFAQLESAIVRAEKTKIGQALVNLIRENPDPEFWTIGKRTLKRFTDLYGEPFEGYEEAPDGMIEGLDYHRVKHVSAAERKAAEAEGRKPVAKVAYKLDPAYRQRDDVFAVMIEGKELLINIKDQVVAEQLKRMNSAQFNQIVATAGIVNRYLAMVSTALNPEFVITNFERDIQTALVHLSGEQTNEMAWKVFKSIPAAGRGIWQSTFDTKGTSPWRAEYDEMQREGGTIGFFGLEDIETKIKHINNRLDNAHSAFGKGKKAVLGLRDLVLDANLAVENSARLAAYVAMRDSLMANGMPAKHARAKAASVAKNLTVNFNRKGEAGPLINSLYLFYNASIQGAARILHSITTSPRTRKIVAGMVVVGFMQAMFNRMSGGEDEDDIPEWDKISDYTKQTHMIFMLPGLKEPVKFKMPYGYNVFHYTGTALHDLIFNPKQTTMGTAMNLLSAVMNSYNPIQGADVLDTITPTILKPWEQSTRNINFMGAPIKPEYPFDQYDRPESQKFFKSTNPELKEFMALLNDVTGGDETHPGAVDVSPETVKHYIKWLFGGAGATVSRTVGTATNLISGEPIDSRNVPFLRTLTVSKSSYYDSQRFYESLKQVAAVEAQLKLHKGTDEYSDYLDDHKEVHKLAIHVPRYKRRIKALREQRDKAYADKDTEAANDYREQIRREMMEFSKRYDDAIEAQE